MPLNLMKGDITKIKVDVIVNAANNSLLGGGGVDGAIHRAGGKTILEECVKIRNKQSGCPTGEAVITSAGLLDAEYVIHTVGPVYVNGNHHEKELLENCYKNSLKLASKYNCQSIAFPNISTGVYCYQKEDAARIAIETVINYLKEINDNILVIFVCFDDENYKLYQLLLGDKDD